jgi:hypothetical protein
MHTSRFHSHCKTRTKRQEETFVVYSIQPFGDDCNRQQEMHLIASTTIFNRLDIEYSKQQQQQQQQQCVCFVGISVAQQRH